MVAPVAAALGVHSTARAQGPASNGSRQLDASNHLYDQFWRKLGIDYDGANPRYADLYHDNRDEPFLNKSGTWYTTIPKFQRHWFDRISDLVETYQPDLLYSDGGLPFGEVGRTLVARFYNNSIRGGKVDAVYNCKDLGSGEFHLGAAVQDVERSVLNGISPLPWQTDTSNGDWFYNENYGFKTTDTVVSMLADIVSKNGNLLLNIVQCADGSLPPQSEQLVTELAAGMKVNSQAIHGTRPWKIHGEGPTETAAGAFKEDAAYTAKDIRFTTVRDALYALTLGEPSGTVEIRSLALGNLHERRRVRQVRLLGHPGPMRFRQADQALVIELPEKLPTRHSSVFKVDFA
ncbi:hypothetical protein C7E20_15235 [Sphingobium sp. AEW4]|nr:alpha-L-fucosidase [Sphingobium sp. JAI105]PSO10883.1 hypothetical protein C7E20_15235 [Sphingobium sp. AEW4]